MVNKQKLEGLIAAPFTPMTADGALNLAAVSYTHLDVYKRQLPEGTNLYGRVYSGGEALEGVPVSDGLNVVTSDAQGVWSMVSDRASDVVFVTLPRGYEAAADGPVPQFYHLLDAGRDRYDFALTATGTDEYVLLATADIQIDNSSRLMVPQSSLTSCRNSFVTDFAKTVAELGGRRVYGLSVGDMIFDKNMYLYGFGFPEYRSLIGEFGIPFFLSLIHISTCATPGSSPTRATRRRVSRSPSPRSSVSWSWPEKSTTTARTATTCR